MPRYTPNTRQFRIRESTHDSVRKLAMETDQLIADLYGETIARVLAKPWPDARPRREPMVRQAFDVTPEVYGALQLRAEAEGLTPSELLDREAAAMVAADREPA